MLKISSRFAWNRFNKLIVLTLLLTSSHLCIAAQTNIDHALPSTKFILAQTLFGLAFIVALIFGLAWVLRRFNVIGTPQNSSIRIVSSIALGTREKVALIEVEGQRVLVGVCPGNIRTLHILDKTQSESSVLNSGDECENGADAADDIEVIEKGQCSSLSASTASEFSRKLSAFLGSGNKH